MLSGHGLIGDPSGDFDPTHGVLEGEWSVSSKGGSRNTAVIRSRHPTLVDDQCIPILMQRKQAGLEEHDEEEKMLEDNTPLIGLAC